MIWPAPAKLNLFLHVVGRRSDGRHLLQTVFQFLDYGDELTFRVTDDGCTTRTHELRGVPPEADLALRAARLLKQRTGCAKGAEIGLTKRIPLGAGLGGGSSDAATTLLALNQLWGIGLTRPELAALGLELGADVPVFIHGRAAWAEGIGEILTPVDVPESWYVVVVPPVQVSTADVYGAFAGESRLTPYTPPRTIRDLRDGFGHNDLERTVRGRYPPVARAFEWLAPHGSPRMTGSGAAVFLRTPDAEHGRQMLAGLPREFTGFVARALNRHPLKEIRGTRYEVR